MVCLAKAHDLCSSSLQRDDDIKQRETTRMVLILVVDDDRSVLNIVGSLLRNEGYEVDTATSAEEAVKKVKDHAYHIVVTDMRMKSETSGLEVLKAAKEADDATEVIIVTGFDEAAGAHEEIFAHLSKRGEGPQEYELLVTLVKKALDHRKTRRAAKIATGCVKALCAAIEIRDPHLRDHSTHVADLVRQLAKEVGLDEEAQDEAWLAGMVHDIGVAAIDPALLLKSSPLSDEEIAVIRSHPNVGTEIVAGIRDLAGIIAAINQHHERYDGDLQCSERPAYPGRVKGDEIDRIARLVIVAEAFVAITSERTYRRFRSPQEKQEAKTRAIEEIRNENTKQFHPEAVEAFLRLVAKGKV